MNFINETSIDQTVEVVISLADALADQPEIEMGYTSTLSFVDDSYKGAAPA